MIDSASILMTIRSVTDQGQQFIGERWMGLFYTLRSHLQQDAQEELEGNEELLLFRYYSPATALRSLFERLDQVKQEYHWDQTFGPVPVQIILHLGKETSLPQPLRDPATNVWALLQHEAPYISKPLREKWQELLEGEDLPAHHIGAEEMGLCLLKFPDRSPVAREPLFPHRHLTQQGKEKKCFYCGMVNHVPANCPSKLLTMQTQGLPLVGYLSLARFNDLFREAFTQQDRLLTLLAAGLTAPQLRKDLVLQIFVSYFDLCKVYQPRFLNNIAFTVHTRWHELGRAEAVTVDSHSLHLGLDCLRVGQYAQAEDLFIDESRRPKGKQFYATIGRAFVALELGRDHDMGHFLESALRMTTSDKDRIYISLLLSRYYDLLGDTWKAEHALDNIFSIDRNCSEALYRQIDLSVKNGFGDRAIRQLRALVIGEKELFMHALLDPELLAIQVPVEDILSSRLQTQQQDAEEHLAKARVTCQELQGWLAEDEQEMQALLGDLATIEKQYEQHSYYDMIDVAEKARVLLRACYRVQEAKLDALKTRIEQTRRRWEGYRSFWNTYSYQSLFRNFQLILEEIRGKQQEAQGSAERNMHGQLYRDIIAKLDSSGEHFTTLKQLTVRMSLVRSLLDGVKLFARRLIITELALLALGIILIPLLVMLLTDTAASGLIQLLRDPWFQKQAIFVTTLFVAPILALAQTLWVAMEP